MSSSSSSHTNSSGFGITLHHEGQNDQNSLAPSPSSGTGHPGKQTIGESGNQQGNIDEEDIKNNKP